MVKDSKDWWKVARELRDDALLFNVPIPSEELKCYFQQLLNPPQISCDMQYANTFYTDEDLDKNITLNEVELVLAKAKLNKSPGEDRIPYEFFKKAPNELLYELVRAFNVLFDGGEINKIFTKSIIFPIFKKGDASVPNNYRGISFMNCLAKIMLGLVAERLSNWSDKHNILNEFQAGFRKNYSTADNIYILSSLVHLNFSEGKKTYAFFVDFKAAFDKVSRKALIYKLQAIGISAKMVRFIEKIYENTTFAVWTGHDLSDEFSTSSGVKQGCLLSPLLFAFYLNDLHDFLGCGMRVGGINVRILLYADDIVILADEAEILQRMIYKLEEYCNLWNMEVNLSKSQIMIFRKGGRVARNEKWFLNGQNITVTSEYCYLGVTLTPKMVFTKHIEKRNMAAKNSINATWKSFLQKNSVSLNAKWKVYLAVCRAIQTYGAQVWGFSHFEEVDKLAIYFVKKILRLPKFTPTYVLMLETGFQNGHLYSLDLHLRYIEKTCFIYTEDRLPYQLTKKLLQRKISWVNDLNNLGSEFNITWIHEKAVAIK